MIYDLRRSVDLRWLFDPVLHSSLDDLVSTETNLKGREPDKYCFADFLDLQIWKEWFRERTMTSCSLVNWLQGQIMARGLEKPVWSIPLPWGPGSISDDATPPLGVKVNSIWQKSLDNLHDSRAIISLFPYLTRSWSKGGQFTEECEARDNLQPPRSKSVRMIWNVSG